MLRLLSSLLASWMLAEDRMFLSQTGSHHSGPSRQDEPGHICVSYFCLQVLKRLWAHRNVSCHTEKVHYCKSHNQPACPPGGEPWVEEVQVARMREQLGSLSYPSVTCPMVPKIVGIYKGSFSHSRDYPVEL